MPPRLEKITSSGNHHVMGEPIMSEEDRDLVEDVEQRRKKRRLGPMERRLTLKCRVIRHTGACLPENSGPTQKES
jgi:hypothetical protein